MAEHEIAGVDGTFARIGLLLDATPKRQLSISEEDKPLNDSTSPALPDIDSFWNYDDPAGTESQFRKILAEAQASSNNGSVAELMTQIARTQNLQQRYVEASATLDLADALIQPTMKKARIRSLLERGRGLNSSGLHAESIPFFREALGIALENKMDFFAVDAAHMLGVAAKGAESLRWNEKAIELAESSKEERARQWLGPLYNNTGWTYSDMGRYQEALQMFEKDVVFRKQSGKVREMNIALWSMASMLRRTGRVEEALSIQVDLLNQPERQQNISEGHTREEIGECLLLLGKNAEAGPQFARAWELLHDDPWLQRDEPKRLERLKSLGAVK